MGSTSEDRRPMQRSCSGMSAASSAFSECRSDISDDPLFLLGSSSGHATAEYYTDEVVLRLISDLESPSVESQCRAAMELRLLSKNSTDNRLRIAGAGAVPPLVALLSHPDLRLQEHGVTAILNLAICDENKAPIAAAGAVPLLVRALCSGSPVTRRNAACAVFRLAQLDDLSAAIGCSGAIPPLVELLESGSPCGKKDAATALFILVARRDNGALAVEAGVVSPLLELMADPDSSMVDKAACVLLRVLAAPEGRAVAVDEGGVAVLVEMLETGSRRQKEIALKSLLEICKDSASCVRVVVREGAIPPLLALYHSSSSSRRIKERASTLVELLRQSSRSRTEREGALAESPLHDAVAAPAIPTV